MLKIQDIPEHHEIILASNQVQLSCVIWHKSISGTRGVFYRVFSGELSEEMYLDIEEAIEAYNRHTEEV